MFRVNENYLKLPGSYLFSTIAKKVAAGACGRTLQPRMDLLDIRKSSALILLRPIGNLQLLQLLMKRSFPISRRSVRETQEPER